MGGGVKLILKTLISQKKKRKDKFANPEIPNPLGGGGRSRYLPITSILLLVSLFSRSGYFACSEKRSGAKSLIIRLDYVNLSKMFTARKSGRVQPLPLPDATMHVPVIIVLTHEQASSEQLI